MDTEIKRPNYFRAQFLVEEDFQDEQAYHSTLRQQHLLALHGWGVVGDGLRITRTTGSDRSITIDTGVAVDNKGREIILTTARTVQLPDGDGPFIVSIRYDEFQADSDRYTGPGADALNTHTRITETPSFVFGTPGNDDVPLAQIRLNQNPPIDDSVRRYVSSWIAPGANLPEVTINNVLTVAGGANVSENLTVSGNLELQGNSTLGNADSDQITIRGLLRSAHSSGALEVDDALHTTGSLTVDANVGIGTTNPSQRLTIQGDYQATVDAKQLVIQGNTNQNNQLELGYHTRDNYGSIQAITQSTGARNFVLNPLGGNVGIGTTNPEAKLTLQTPDDFSGNITRFEVKREPSNYNLTLNTNVTNGVVRWVFNQTNSGNPYNSVLVIDRGKVGIGATNPRNPLAIRAQDRQESLISFEDPQGNTKWHLEQNLGGNRPGLNFVETGVADGRLFIAAGGNVGIGTTTPSNRLHVQSNVRGSLVENATVLFENTVTNPGEFTTVLALRASAISDLKQAFIRFFNPSGQIGGIHAKGNNIQFSGVSADYAECLPRFQADEVIEPGDIVGVFGGKITKTVTGAHHVMAITDKPIVLGNTPESQYQHLYEPVSFLGQVSVKVRGAVQLGDFIIPSGLNDGTGIAVSPEKITPIQYTQIVGRAWEASDCEEMKRINTVVGLPSSNPQLSELLTIMQAQQAEISTLKAELNSVKMLLAQSV
jgi:hypothetical protein